MNKLGILSLFILFISPIVIASELKVTQEHPFYLDGEWVEAKELQVGDILKTYEGMDVRITSIEEIEIEIPFYVYNLEAEPYHDFIVEEGLIVHNSNFMPKTPERVYEIEQADILYKTYQSEGMDLENLGLALRYGDGDVSKVSLTPKDIYLESAKEVPNLLHGPPFKLMESLLQTDIVMWGKASQRYNSLISFSKSTIDLPIHQRVNRIYGELQQTIGTDMSCRYYLAMSKVLKNSGGVCRHKARLLSDMLRKAGVKSTTISNFGHVWVRVNDPTLGKFDLDPTWYLGPVRLPPRTKVDVGDWSIFVEWEKEFLRLNNPSFLDT
jgi:hypothetical protein